MTYEEFYAESYGAMRHAEKHLLDMLRDYPKSDSEDLKPIIYCCSRIKSPESMIRKLEKSGFVPTGENALAKMFDAVGIRVVCAFAEDVYHIVSWLSSREDLEIIREKDYIAYPKPNGYRSYHLQIRLISGIGEGLPAEIQVRTIATDFWAALEHQLKYKKDLPHEELIRSELKRCADEIASVDLSMQTIRDIIRKAVWEES